VIQEIAALLPRFLADHRSTERLLFVNHDDVPWPGILPGPVFLSWGSSLTLSNQNSLARLTVGRVRDNCASGNRRMLDMQRSGTGPPQHPRLQAPVYFTKLGSGFFRSRHRTFDPRLGGARIYTDEEPKEGSQLEIEIFLPDDTTVICKVGVSRVELLAPGSPATYDVGLCFIAIHPHDRERLSAVLKLD
jgi:hypothetical protein